MSDSQQQVRVLVVEDEYLLAADMCRSLTREGLIAVGPAGSIEAALALIESEAIDAAVLDISLNGENINPVVDALTKRGTPFVFATGYDAFDLPPAWQQVPRYEKPVNAASVAKALRGKAK